MIPINHFKRSFRAAFHGIGAAWKTEQSFRAQAAIAVFVVAAMLVLPVSKPETIILTLLIMAVLSLELLNSILERIVNVLEPRIHPFAQEVKDMMAAAVLVTSLGALIIGVLILGPYALRAL